MAEISAAANELMSDFNAQDRKELQQFLANEQQKAKFQENVHNLTGMCWNKCLAANKISGPAMDRSEESCVANCVNRFLDTQTLIVNAVQKMSGGQ